MTNIGISSRFGYRLPLHERLQLIKDTGFASTFLWLGVEEELVASGHADHMPALVRDIGLSIDHVHAPYEHCNLLWSDSAQKRNLITGWYKEYISYCNRHDIPILVLHLTRGDIPPPETKEGLVVLGHLVKYAEDANVIIALENTRCPGYLDSVFAHVTSPHLGLCYDSSHDSLWGDPPGAILKQWGHLLAATHFSDNDGENDDHWLPEEGRVDWGLIRSSFPSETYSGNLILEVVPGATGDISAQAFLNMAFQRAISLHDLLLERTSDQVG